MKYIKTYESIENKPQQFDWCVCDIDVLNRKKFRGKLGRIMLFSTERSDLNPRRCFVQFKDGSGSWFLLDDIIFFSKRKMDVQFYLNKEVNKYNL